MGSSTKNLIIVLGIITIAFAGYYLYSQNVSSGLGFSKNQQVEENILNNSRVFISRRQALDKISLDMKILDDERFRSLRSFSSPLVEPNKGKENPFEEIDLTAEVVMIAPVEKAVLEDAPESTE